MRILYVVNNWPSLFEADLLREVHWMKNRGHEVAVVSMACVGPHGFRHETASYVDLTHFGVEDVPVLRLESKQMPMEALIGPGLAFARDHGPQLVDAHFAREPAELACDIYKAIGVPYAVRLRGGDVHTNTSRRLAEILDHASAVCPMSQFLADILVGNRIAKRSPAGIPADVSASRLTVLPNCLPESYRSNRPAPQSDNRQVVGAIGRVVPDKRLEDLVKAIARLVNDFPGLRLLIIGGGTNLTAVEQLAAELGISQRFEITGFKSSDQVMALAGRLHIYVQASEVEGCSLSTIEAGFKGIPLVLSRTGANEECVEQGTNGYLFDPGDVDAITESLRLLLLAGKERRERMGAESLRIVGQRFSAETILPRVESVFRAVASSEAIPVYR